MKRILKKGKVGGTVLLTTTGVMLVLVVFLMSTLVLATSSNRRSYYTYYETQAQYAAQAALDAVTSSAYNDPEFHRWIVQNITPGTAARPVTVDFTSSSIQFTDDYDSVNCFIESVQPSYVWDDVTQAVHRQDAWRITAVASVGNGRNASEASVSNYLYENFQVEDPSLMNSVQNTAENTVYDYTPSVTPTTTPPLSTLVSAVSSLSASATNNNFTSLGPQGSGLSGLPLGRILYDSAPGDYTASTINDNFAVGNVLFVNNVYSSVLRHTEFQHFGESAIYYGNLYSKNKGGNAGFRWISNMSTGEVGAEGEPIQYLRLPYVYVDGRMICDTYSVPNPNPGQESETGGGGFYVGCNYDGTPGTHPVNLYAGGIQSSGANNDFAIFGDAYLYDPGLDSVWSNGLGGVSALRTFVFNNITQSGSHYGHTGTGNLFCNNHSLEIKGGTNIDGDLIFTNKSGTLTISGPITVGGKVVCAGTLVGAENLTVGTNEIVTGDACANWYDGTYGTHCAFDDYVARADAIPLMPFSYRIDEIHKRYTRWDLKSGDEATARQNMNADPLIAESIATGHTWDVMPFTTVEDVPQYSRIEPGQPGFDPGSAIYDASNNYQGYNLILVGITSTTTTNYAPYTTPIHGSGFIPEYNPVSPATAMQTMTHSSSYDIESTARFSELMDSGAPVYNNANKPSFYNNIPVVYHDEAAHEQRANVNAYVINTDCTIDLNDGYNSATIFIDPTIGNHGNSNPLYVKFTGTNIANCNTTVIINNTASYSPDYTTTVIPYATESPMNFAERREVYIFFEDGFGSAAGAFKLCCSGAYGQMTSGQWNVVSNPIYPDNANWSSLREDVKYAYELVPNVTIFGEANGTFTFRNACFLNADILIPNGTIKNENASNYQARITYREFCDSNSFGPSERSTVGVGSCLVRSLSSTPNIAQLAYIGDSRRTSTPPSIRIVDRQTNGNSDYLGQENQDYFANQYRGPN